MKRQNAGNLQRPKTHPRIKQNARHKQSIIYNDNIQMLLDQTDSKLSSPILSNKPTVFVKQQQQQQQQQQQVYPNRRQMNVQRLCCQSNTVTAVLVTANRHSSAPSQTSNLAHKQQKYETLPDQLQKAVVVKPTKQRSPTKQLVTPPALKQQHESRKAGSNEANGDRNLEDLMASLLRHTTTLVKSSNNSQLQNKKSEKLNSYTEELWREAMHMENTMENLMKQIEIRAAVNKRLRAKFRCLLMLPERSALNNNCIQ